MLAVTMSLWPLARPGTSSPVFESDTETVDVKVAAAMGYGYPEYVNVAVFPYWSVAFAVGA